MHTLIHSRPKKQKCLEEELYQAGLVLFAVAAVAVPFWVSVILPKLNLTQNGCIVWMLFGAYCPGCGGTRAVNALLHGHFLLSLWYHPLVLYSFVLYFVFMVSWTVAKFGLFGIKKGIAFRTGYIYGMVIVIAVNFLTKNLLKFCFGIIML